MKKSEIKTVTKTVIIIAALVLLIVFAFPNGCTKPDDTIRVLTQQGYTNIEITGWRPFMASEKDTFSTGFRATGPNGVENVTGAVTAGWFKGYTIRLD